MKVHHVRLSSRLTESCQNSICSYYSINPTYTELIKYMSAVWEQNCMVKLPKL